MGAYRVLLSHFSQRYAKVFAHAHACLPACVLQFACVCVCMILILSPTPTQVPVMREVAEDVRAMFAFDLMTVDLSCLPLMPRCCDPVARLSAREDWGEGEEDVGV